MKAVFTLLMLLPLVLAACGGSDMNPQDAEKGLEAAFSGNIEEAKNYFCEEEIESLEENADTMAALGELTADATCAKDGDAMKCDYTISGAVLEGTEATELSSDTVRFNIRDGKLCGEAN